MLKFERINYEYSHKTIITTRTTFIDGEDGGEYELRHLVDFTDSDIPDDGDFFPAHSNTYMLTAWGYINGEHKLIIYGSFNLCGYNRNNPNFIGIVDSLCQETIDKYFERNQRE